MDEYENVVTRNNNSTVVHNEETAEYSPSTSEPSGSQSNVTSNAFPENSLLRYSSGWDNRTWAMYWHSFGLDVIPILTAEKHPAVKWDPWLDGLDEKKINAHWSKFPDHDIGCVVGDGLIVLDADTVQSSVMLRRIEESTGVTPSLIISTKRGEHHYFRRGAETLAKSDSHCSDTYPYRLDVKTGRAIAILPPSTGKSIKAIVGDHMNMLSEVGQSFIDKVCELNGRQTASKREERKPVITTGVADESVLIEIRQHLVCINPDRGYEDWRNVAMAIFNITGGSEEGFSIFDEWSSGSTKKYPGTGKLKEKWNSFELRPDGYGMGTLIMMSRDDGASISTSPVKDAFDVCDYEVVHHSQEPDAKDEKTPCRRNPLARYSLRGMSEDIGKQIVEAKSVLKGVALMGEVTVIYAPPNTGKTLLTLSLLIDSINSGETDPENVYYVNVDDSISGLHEKLCVAEDFRFHMLAEGHRNFKAKELLNLIDKMINEDTAQGVVIILDTLKRFVDLMSKKDCSYFSSKLRNFAMKGGTVIALAHTNKNRRDGKLIEAGTSDILDDCDCAFILDTYEGQPCSGRKIIEFKNRKRRGDVEDSAFYSYQTDKKGSYLDLVASVERIEDIDAIALRTSAQVQSDAEVITAIELCIAENIRTKMELMRHAADRAKVSQRTSLQVIERYTGNDPNAHRWFFQVKDRGAKVYDLLSRPEGQSHDPGMGEE